MKEYVLNYGDRQVKIDLSGATETTVLQDKPLVPIQDLQQELYAALENPIDSLPLQTLVNKNDQVTVVISDITRFYSRQDKICTLLIQYLLEEMELLPEQIVVLIALGTHRPQTEEELRKIAGAWVYERVQVVNHNCMADNLVCFGTTSFGTEVWMNALAKDRKIINIGSTIHHLMAGFGGGRKNILPGIAGKKTINQNHLHSLDPKAARSNPLIGAGLLPNNPVHEDMDEAAALVNPTFGIYMLVDGNSQHTCLCAGNWRTAWLKSCEIAEQTMGVPIEEKADVVVVSCGGYPKDISLYQGCKSLLNASRAVKPDGTMVFLAECQEGGGADEFFGWIKSLSKGTLDADLRANFSIAGYIFYACCEAVAKCEKVIMLTEIPPEIVHDIGIKAFDTAEKLQREIQVENKKVYIMPFGGNTVPVLSGN